MTLYRTRTGFKSQLVINCCYDNQIRTGFSYNRVSAIVHPSPRTLQSMPSALDYHSKEYVSGQKQPGTGWIADMESYKNVYRPIIEPLQGSGFVVVRSMLLL